MKQTFLFFFLLSFSKWGHDGKPILNVNPCTSSSKKFILLLMFYKNIKQDFFFFQKCAYFLQHKGVLFSDENLPKEDALFYEYVLHDHFRTFWWKLRNQMRKHIEWYLCLAKYLFIKELFWYGFIGVVPWKNILSYFSKCKSCKKANNFPIYFF